MSAFLLRAPLNAAGWRRIYLSSLGRRLGNCRSPESDCSNAGWQRDLSVSYENVGEVEVEEEGHLPEALQSYQAGWTIREALTKSDPGNAGWQSDFSVSYDKVGDVHMAQDHLPEPLQPVHRRGRPGRRERTN